MIKEQGFLLASFPVSIVYYYCVRVGVGLLLYNEQHFQRSVLGGQVTAMYCRPNPGSSM